MSPNSIYNHLYFIKLLLNSHHVYNNFNFTTFTVYIDAGVGITTPVTLTFVTSGPSFARKWKVKICQIPCSTTYRGNMNI